MPLKQFNLTDLWFTVDGDFLIDGAGDLKDTKDSGDLNEGVRQSIIHRLVGEQGAFRLHPGITVGLEQFIGRPINDELLEGMQFAIHRALVSDGILNRDDYVIRVFELTPGNIMIMIFVSLPNQEHPIVSMAWNVEYGEVTRI